MKTKVDQWLDSMETPGSPAVSTSAAVAGSTGLVSLGGDVGIAGMGAPLAPSANGDALAALWTPKTSTAAPRKTVEDLLIAAGKLDAEKLLQAKGVQSTSRSKKLSHILMEMGAVSEEDVQHALAEVLNLEFFPIDPKKLDRRAFEYLPGDFMKSRGCCGVRFDEGNLTLGMVDPADVFLLDEVKRRVSAKVTRIVVVSQTHIAAAIEAGNAAK